MVRILSRLCRYHGFWLKLLVLLSISASLSHSVELVRGAGVDAAAGIEKSVTLVGLGGMGRAVLQCYQRHGYRVHGWNRTPRRDEFRGGGGGITIHDSLEDAIAATSVVLVVINSEPNLKTVHDRLFKSSSTSSSSLLAGKTLVNLVNHEAFAARDLETELEKYDMHHVAGSLFAVPEAICSPGALILLSSSDRSTKAMEELIPSLSLLGTVETFAGDVGYGSVVILCLIQTLYFGLAGFELALLVLEKYGVPSETVDRFLRLERQVVREQYYPHLSQVVASNIRNREWTKSYVPARAALVMFEMHAAFFARLGIVSDTFQSVYVKYLAQAAAADGGAKGDRSDVGISAVVKHYSSDNFELEDRTTGDEL